MASTKPVSMGSVEDSPVKVADAVKRVIAKVSEEKASVEEKEKELIGVRYIAFRGCAIASLFGTAMGIGVNAYLLLTAACMHFILFVRSVSVVFGQARRGVSGKYCRGLGQRFGENQAYPGYAPRCQG